MIVIAPLLLVSQLAAAAGAPASPELARAEALLAERKLDEAWLAFKRAHEAAGKRCFACLAGLAEAEAQLGKLEQAVKHSDEALALGSQDVALRVRVLDWKGVALLGLGASKPGRLPEAERALSEAVALRPDDALARFSLGLALMRQSKDALGRTQLEDFLQRWPEGRDAAHARRLIQNPRRARERFAPDFAVRTLSGEAFSLDGLRGKPVLLDFWATWCAPCREALPELRDLRRRYAGQSLMLLSVSVDEDEQAWRGFVEREGMSWPQYRDADRSLVESFGVHAFPTYVLLDGEGAIVAVVSGTDRMRSVAARLRGPLEALLGRSRR